MEWGRFHDFVIFPPPVRCSFSKKDCRLGRVIVPPLFLRIQLLAKFFLSHNCSTFLKFSLAPHLLSGETLFSFPPGTWAIPIGEAGRGLTGGVGGGFFFVVFFFFTRSKEAASHLERARPPSWRFAGCKVRSSNKRLVFRKVLHSSLLSRP